MSDAIGVELRYVVGAALVPETDEVTVGVSVPIVAASGGSSGGGAVDSVNTQTGVVVLDAGDIGFTAVGTIAATDTQTAVAEVATDAAAALTAHEGASDPHPGYLTSAEGAAAYDALGAADGKVSDTAYDATSWDGDTTHAPSKNAVRDKIESLSAGGVTSVDGNTGAVTASQLLTSIKTVDGAGSGLDADLLDGISSAAFAPVASPTFTGTVTVPSGAALGTPTSVNLSNATSLADAALAATGTAGTYGSASLIPVITTDAKGRVTGVTTATPTVADPPTVSIIARQNYK